jgi:hypothetical protein
MKRLLKHGILSLLTLLYLGHGISACLHATPRPETGQETTGGERAYRELSAVPGETVMGTGSHATVHVEPAFRYPPRDSRAMLEQVHERALVPRYHHVRSFYLFSFALRQDAGYYVFSLREIIV